MPISRSSRLPRAQGSRAPGRVVAVRLARSADAAAIVRLRLALLADDGHGPRTPATRASDTRSEARALTRRQLGAPNAPFFVATHEGRVVGLIRVAATRGSPLLGEPAYGTLTTAYVEPAYRRRGVMRRLVEHAVAWCKARALADVRLRCAARNVRANAAWDAMGFAVAAVVRRRPTT